MRHGVYSTRCGVRLTCAPNFLTALVGPLGGHIMVQKTSCAGWAAVNGRLSEYELDQILAETVRKLGADRIMECVELYTRN